MSENMEMMGEIARVLATHEELSSMNWVEISVVFLFVDAGSVNNTYGYTYDAYGEWEAISFRPRDVREAVDS